MLPGRPFRMRDAQITGIRREIEFVLRDGIGDSHYDGAPQHEPSLRTDHGAGGSRHLFGGYSVLSMRGCVQLRAARTCVCPALRQGRERRR